MEREYDTEWVDLFLLSSVLFPSARMGLRIFEPRYLDMVTRSFRQQRPFGICLPEGEGGEAPNRVGTLARITDWGSENGLLLIQVEGMDRFSVDEWQTQAQITVARIHTWRPEPKLPLAFEHAWLKPLLRELVTEDPDTLDASTASMLLAQALPARTQEKLQLLNLQDPLERLRRIGHLLSQQRRQ